MEVVTTQQPTLQPTMLHPDIVKIDDVKGAWPGPSWSDSYSVGNRCYCDTTFDHNIGPVMVDTGTFLGSLNVSTICTLLGDGPGKEGRPVYNDVQCGNGPPNDAGDENDCPGRVDLGRDGCGQIGPVWNFDEVLEMYVPTPMPTLHPDIVKVIDVEGEEKPKPSWRDSYSVGDRCYCSTTFDHNIGPVMVDTNTSLGRMNVTSICRLLGSGPGRRGNPQYNDVQCGNGPANDAGDEDNCPGRVDLGPEGCGQIGPRWNFDDFVSVDVDEGEDDEGTGAPVPAPTPMPTLHPDIVKVIDVVGEDRPRPSWRDSYSIGDRCYCSTTFDHNIGPVMVDTNTSLGRMNVTSICRLLGNGPGRRGNPQYNDVQCGNGPANDAGDEDNCPGRVDLGPEGCGQIGPRWNFGDVLSSPDDENSDDDDDQTTSSPTITPAIDFQIPQEREPTAMPTSTGTREQTTTPTPKTRSSMMPTTAGPTFSDTSSTPSEMASDTPTEDQASLIPTTSMAGTLPPSARPTTKTTLSPAVPKTSRPTLNPSTATPIQQGPTRVPTLPPKQQLPTPSPTSGPSTELSASGQLVTDIPTASPVLPAPVSSSPFTLSPPNLLVAIGGVSLPLLLQPFL